MFRKLKRKFVLTNVLTSSAILIIAFSTIYVVAAHGAAHRMQKPFDEEPQMRFDNPAFNDDYSTKIKEEIDERLEDERRDSLQSLLISLIVSGVAMEIIIVAVSFFLAEQSIKPVREAYNAQKAFVANASHEIKTPLAVIQANLEAADIQGNQWIDNVAKKTEDLANLNNQLLTLAKMDAIEQKIELKEVSLPKLVRETSSFYEPQATAKKAAIEIVVSEKMDKDKKIKINKTDFVQLLNILLDNAVKYCKSKVVIEIDQRKVVVTNDGATIKKEDLQHIFDRFYQTDKTRSGVGLGLAIAKQISEHNNWKIDATSDQKTTSFAVYL